MVLRAPYSSCVLTTSTSTGTSIAPIATRYPLPNVRFEIADVTEPYRFTSGSVDMVHARVTLLSVCLYSSHSISFHPSMSIRPYLPLITHYSIVQSHAYSSLLYNTARILRPGGLFLSYEWGLYPALHPDHPCCSANGEGDPNGLSSVERWIPATTKFFKRFGESVKCVLTSFYLLSLFVSSIESERNAN